MDGGGDVSHNCLSKGSDAYLLSYVCRKTGFGFTSACNGYRRRKGRTQFISIIMDPLGPCNDVYKRLVSLDLASKGSLDRQVCSAL